ncbi:SRPBCC domain-containing protein [Asticcacaulis solisilvae]|uniref:SRPBCC domain-containing protein n=1 Tax=Asticcacaulis solisilvae TaxID=1217274 RepID=UPI003FD8AD85
MTQATKTPPKTPTGAEIDTATNTIRLRRSIAAPANKVFEAWTTPSIVSKWWDPDGTPLRECEIDLRPGGAFRFVNESHGDGHAFAGVYREIAAPERLVFDALGAEGTVDLVERFGRTEITVAIVCASPDHLEQFLSLGVARDTGRTLDQLVALFETA